MNNLLSQGGTLDHLWRYLPSQRRPVCRVSPNSPRRAASSPWRANSVRLPAWPMEH